MMLIISKRNLFCFVFCLVVFAFCITFCIAFCLVLFCFTPKYFLFYAFEKILINRQCRKMACIFFFFFFFFFFFLSFFLSFFLPIRPLRRFTTSLRSSLLGTSGHSDLFWCSKSRITTLFVRRSHLFTFFTSNWSRLRTRKNGNT